MAFNINVVYQYTMRLFMEIGSFHWWRKRKQLWKEHGYYCG